MKANVGMILNIGHSYCSVRTMPKNIRNEIGEIRKSFNDNESVKALYDNIYIYIYIYIYISRFSSLFFSTPGSGNPNVLNELKLTFTDLQSCNESWNGLVKSSQLCFGNGLTGACNVSFYTYETTSNTNTTTTNNNNNSNHKCIILKLIPCQ